MRWAALQESSWHWKREFLPLVHGPWAWIMLEAFSAEGELLGELALLQGHLEGGTKNRKEGGLARAENLRRAEPWAV